MNTSILWYILLWQNYLDSRLRHTHSLVTAATPAQSPHKNMILKTWYPSMNCLSTSHSEITKPTHGVCCVCLKTLQQPFIIMTLRSNPEAYSSQIIQTSTNTRSNVTLQTLSLWTSRTHFGYNRSFLFLPSATHPLYRPSFFRWTIRARHTASITCKLSALAVKREETVSVWRGRANEDRELNSCCAGLYYCDFSLAYRRNRRTQDESGDGAALWHTHIKTFIQSNKHTENWKRATLMLLSVLGVNNVWSLSPWI